MSWREAHRRKFSIFSNLMKTRRMILDPLHVSSLNMVEVEFHGHADIIKAYRAYLDYLNKPIQLNPSSPEADNFFRERDDLLFDLIHAIGGQLGYSYDKRDLRKFSYAPQGWQNVETEQQTFRRLIIELLSGRRPLPIKDFIASDGNDKFPPPPKLNSLTIASLAVDHSDNCRKEQLIAVAVCIRLVIKVEVPFNRFLDAQEHGSHPTLRLLCSPVSNTRSSRQLHA